MKTSTKDALLLAAAYLVVGVLYIVVSGQMVSNVAVSAEDAAKMEFIKGVVYMLVTSVLLGAGARVLFERAERRTHQLNKQQQALMLTDRRAAAGLMAASLAHDANNVLTTLLGELDELKHVRGEEALGRGVQRMETGVQRLAQLHQHLRNAGRQTFRSEPKASEATALVAETQAAFRTHLMFRGCTMRTVSPEPCALKVDHVLFAQVLSNLLLNAAEATGGRGEIEVRIASTGDGVSLEVDDNGPGIPADRQAGIFEALSTTKPDGSGLGLFSVRACTKVMGGSVTLEKSRLGGACFRVVLPRTPPPA